MITRKYIPLVVSILALIVFSAFASSDDLFVAYFKKKINEYNLYYPSEKAYLHTDKTFYKPGDDIWISAYLLDGISHMSSTKSNVIYIELCDPKGSVVKKQMFKIKNGNGKAHYKLANEAPGGLYKLRAYTKWMQNFGNKMIFEKDLQVQKIIKPKILSVLDFEKEAYGASDTVMARLSLRDLSNAPIRNRRLKYVVRLKGKVFLRGTSETNDKGESSIQFTLPNKLNSADGVLNVMFDYKGYNESISGAIPIVLNKIDLQFFPEGGDAIENMSAKMAFKALNEFGKPADVEGEIYNSKGHMVSRFKSFHQGMGAFIFTPLSNQAYTAKILKPSGIGRLYKLPQAKAEGCVLHLKHSDNKGYHFRIQSNVNEKVHIVVHLRGKMLFANTIQLQEGMVEQTIDISEKGLSGIAQITIFDDFERPMAERLFYIFPENKLNIEIKTDKSSYTTREKVQMTLQVNDAEGEPVEGSFSIAVVDDKIITYADDKQDNILSSLMLSSDIKGKVYEPSFYFDPEEEKAKEALDYLLLTQGWRRFVWNDILQMTKKAMKQAERYDMVVGQITNNFGEGVKARVIVVDNEHKKYAKLTTNEGGRFAVSNLNDFKYLQVYAKSLDRKNKNVRINISQASRNTSSNIYGSAVSFGTVQVDPVIAETREVNNSIALELEDSDGSQTLPETKKEYATSAVWAMEDDAVALDEVVTIGYGVQKKSEMTGSIVRVQAQELQGINSEVNYALQGQVAGVQVINSSGSPGSNSSVLIRGTASVSVNNTPLYIVDGIPISDLSPLNAGNIESVNVLKSAASTAIYGSRAANGVIVITTKKGKYGQYSRSRKYAKKLKQTHLYNSFTFGPVKQFYIPPYGNKHIVTDSIDQRETIYWNPTIVTDKYGKANIQFYNSDELTTFRTIVEGVGNNGLVGRAEAFHNTIKPLHIETKIPPYLVFEDVLELPVLITNNTEQLIVGNLNIDLPKSWHIINQVPSQLSIESNSFKEVILKLKVGKAIGEKKINMYFGNDVHTAENVSLSQVVSKGFPAEMSYSARAKSTTFSFDLSNTIKESETMSISIYNDVLSEVMDGIESVIREPYGCFEQASASTYPNVLILKYLQENGLVNPELKTKTLGYIEKGYKKLAAYETKNNGFEWFGHTPPHEGLSAFGLMEFNDMKKVYPGVNEEMIKRTIDWLLSRKDGKGGFKTNKGKYGFSGASDEVTNAYLIYAFSELGIPFDQFKMEYESTWKKAFKSKDAYRLALMANAAINVNDSIRGAMALTWLTNKVAKSGINKLHADHSIVRSYGKSLKVEVAALSAMAIIKNGDEHFTELLTLMDYILGARSFGGFGSTQATILSLKAITQYASLVNKMPESGTAILKINGHEVLKRQIKNNDKLMLLDSLEQYFGFGIQTFELAFEGMRNPLSFTANAKWKQALPASSENCKLRIQTQLMKDSCEVNELVRLSTRIINKSANGLPMTIAMVGLPSGLSVQPWQLKKMQDEHVFDYYEIHKNYVVFYYKELEPNARETINLDLKAEVTGEFSAPPSCTYLYYTKEFKDWHKGGGIVISR